MSEAGLIVRVAAKGDGVTADGRHVPLAAPGDVFEAGVLRDGPHHAVPPCRHYGTCGGCQLQHLDEETLADFVAARVANSAAGQGLEPARIDPPHLSPPRSRRRATLHGQRTERGWLLGFREGGSHRLVDLAECHVLTPDLFALLTPLRGMLRALSGKTGDVTLTQTDQGIDVTLAGVSAEGLAAAEGLTDFARKHALARLSLDNGYGAETVWEPEPVTVTLGGVPVGLPPGGFLQATLDGEAELIAFARDALAGSATVADLFAGLGTFAFALAGPAKVLAVEADRTAHFACKAAAGRSGKPVHPLHRDLFRNPLQPEELNRFAAVLLDPPRAGARDQVEQLAASTVGRVVYISCNPSSWARDAATLVAGGYRLERLAPVGQFRWSTHVELASLFVRD